MWRVALLVLVGCGRLSFEDVAARGDASDIDAPDAVPPGFCASATFSNAAASSMTDDFSVVPFTDRWQPVGPGCITQGTNELVASPSASGSFCHAYTMGLVHLTCDAIFFHVPEVARHDVLGVQTFIYVYSPPTDEFLSILLELDGLQMGWTTGTVRLAESDGYDVVTDAWWRLREHDGEIMFETAPDGIAWTERMRAQTAIDTDHVEIAIGAGTYKPVTAPGQARFRCYNTPPPCN